MTKLMELQGKVFVGDYAIWYVGMYTPEPIDDFSPCDEC